MGGSLVGLNGGAPEQCVILVGGLGTRLGELTKGLPKPLMNVGDRPFLAYLLWHARRFGFRRVLLLAGHRAEAVQAFAGEAAWTDGLEVEVVVEPEPLGTGGALRHALNQLDERFLLLNGDSLFDFNWLDLCAVGAAHPEARIVMSLRQESDASRFGVVVTDGDKVLRFAERGDARGGAINGGVYLMDRAVVAGISAPSSFERDVLPGMAAEGRVFARLQRGFFLDIGVPDALASAQTLVPGSTRRGAVFFDRDGVLNIDHGYTHRWIDFEWVQGAVSAVKAVNDSNMFAFLVTNQAGVARGYYDERTVHELHEAMQAALRGHGAHLDDIRYCPHHPEGVVPDYAGDCGCRKPQPGMILDLLSRWPVDVSASHLIGDKPSDIEAGAAAGLQTTLFTGGKLDETVSAILRTGHAGSRAEGRA